MGGSSSSHQNGATPYGGKGNDNKDYAANHIAVTPGGDAPTPGGPNSGNGNGGVTTNLIVDDPNTNNNNDNVAAQQRALPNGGLAATHQRIPSHQHHSGAGANHHRKDKFKIVMLGGERVGKSAIFRRYITNQFINEHIPTTRVDIGLKILQGLPHNMVLEIWDLPSSPAIIELMKDTYFDGADGAIIVADCAELVTFAQTEPLNKMLMDWQSKKRGGLPLIPVVFFANKCELTPDVKEADIKRKAEREKLSGYLLTSCAKGHKIDQGFTMLLREMIAYEQRRVSVHQHDEDEKRGGMSTNNLVVTPPASRAVGGGVADMGSLQGLGSGKSSRIPQPAGTNAAAAAASRPPLVISERKEHKISIPDDDD